MKYIIKLAIITVLTFVVYTANTQTITDTTKLAFYNKDTMQYFKSNFIKNKSLYLNQPISKLLSKLEFAPQLIYFSADQRIDSVYSITFRFISEEKMDNIFYDKSKGSYYTLSIDLVTAIPTEVVENLYFSIRNMTSRKEYANLKAFVSGYLIKDFSFHRIVYD